MRRHPIKLRWRLLEVLLLLVIVSAGSFFVFVLSERLEARMESLKEQVLVMLERQLGRRISYESISPSVFGFLAIRNFVVFSFDDPQEVLLSVSRLKVHYDIFRFLITKDPVRSLSEIQIAGSRFSVDYDRDRELIEMVRSLTANGSGSGLTGGLPISISGSNITVDYRHGDQEVRVSDLFFSLSSTESRYLVNVRASVEMLYYTQARSSLALGRGWERARRLSGRLGEEPSRPKAEARQSRRLESRLRISGSVDRGLRSSDLGIRIYSLRTDSVALKRQTLQLLSDESGLKLRKIQDRAPIDIQVLFDVASGELSFRFVAEGFRPSSLVELTGDLQRYDPYLGSSISANGSFTYNLNSGHFRYSSRLEVAPAPGALPFRATLTANLRGDDEIVYFEPLVVDTSEGGVYFTGNVLLSNLFPSGLLTVRDLQAPQGRSVDASLVFNRDKQSLSVAGRELRIGEVVFNDLAMTLTPADDAVTFDLKALAGEGSLAAQGRFRAAPAPELAASIRLDGVSPGTITRLIAPRTEVAELATARLAPYSLSLAADTWTDFRAFSVSAPEVRLADRTDPGSRLTFSANASNDMVQVENLELHWGGYELKGQIDAELSPQRTTARSLFWVRDVPYEITADYSPGSGISLTGSYGLAISVLDSGVGDPSLSTTRYLPVYGSPFRIRTQAFPVPLRDGEMNVSLDVVGILSNSGELLARSSSTEITNIPIRALGANSARFSFQLHDRDLTIDRLEYRDSVSSLVGSGAATLRKISPLSAAAQLSMSAVGSAERYAARFDLEGDTLDAELDFDRAPLARLGRVAISGDAKGTIVATGTLQDPQLEATVELQDGRLNVDPLEARVSARVSRKALILRSLDLAILSQQLRGGSGSLDLQTGAFRFNSPYRAEYFGKDVQWNVAIEGALLDPAGLLKGRDLLALGLDGTFRLSDVRVDNGVRPDWLLRLSARNGLLSVKGGAREGVEATIGSDGRFTLSLRDPLPIQGTASGQLSRGKLDSIFRVSRLDMGVITSLTPAEDIWNFQRGTARGDVRISGPVNDPDWFGRMDVSDLVMKVNISPDEVGPASGTVFFDEKTFYFQRLRAPVGKSTVEAEGTFYLDHWEPVAVELSLYFPQEPGAHVRYTFGPMFVDGYGTGAVRIVSDESMTRVEGKVVASNCSVAIQREDTASEEPPPKVPPLPLLVDIKIKTGRGIEFFWPTINFPVVHSYVKQGEDLVVYLDESTGELAIKGQAEIRGGEVFYFDRSFYLKEGSITFEESVGEIDPWIRALAEIRERDVNNEEVRIYLEANNRLSQFSPRFYSEPSRPDLEILNMIGGTILNRFEDTDFGTAAVMLTSDIVGQFGILTPFERAVRNVLRLDLFSIRTQFLQNVLFGKILGTDSQLAGVNPLDNTTLSLGKYLGTDLFLEALIRFQAVNDINAVNNIRTEGELSLEWATPFFLLEWTFTPLHPESLFLTDNNIGLSWKFSY